MTETDIGDDWSRRRLVRLGAIASFLTLSGCAGNGDGNEGDTTPTETATPTDTATPTETPTPTPATPSPSDAASSHESPHPTDQVPEAEANGNSLNGIERGTPPESKDGIGFQHTPKDEEKCGNCSQYVPDETGDGYGACTIVSGTIHPCDWCQLWVEFDGDGVPCED